MRSLLWVWIGLTVAIACSCIDGAYHLTALSPQESEGKQKAAAQRVYSVSRGSLKIAISGGQMQRPFTKKVEASGLDLVVHVESQSPFFFAAPAAKIISCGANFSPSSVSVETEGSNIRSISTWSQAKTWDLDQRFPAGRALFHITFGHFQHCPGGLLEFPIQVDLGTFANHSDTLMIAKLIMDAAR